MFYDHVKIEVRSGNGGNGAVSFRREKYLPNGGPDGGNGGRGGSVIIRADQRKNTLLDFRYKKRFVANDGEGGGKNNRIGKSADDIVIFVPPGTMIRDANSDRLIADLVETGDEVIVAEGGRGGVGNAYFKSSVRQAPQFSKAGKSGVERTLTLELKLLADVAFVGYPNAGKSTLLSVLTAATPKIASYPFTTLEPQLGVLQYDDQQVVLADIPGLVEGAAGGAGMGTDFLRHIERSRLLLHVVDAAAVDGREPYADYLAINEELSTYKEQLAERDQWVVLAKADVADPDTLESLVEKLSAERKTFVVSAVTQRGIPELKQALAAIVPLLPKPEFYDESEARKVYRFEEKPLYEIALVDGHFVVSGDWIRELVQSTNFTDRESLRFFEREIKRNGLYDDLQARGITEEDTVVLAGSEFEWVF
ncbi:MAG TPA: GTPase ObgE [Fastidiosipila sp.]|nr:GTPase ObgE [Fastidiosipila sp.]